LFLFGSEEVEPGANITVPAGFDGRLDLLLSPNGGTIDGRVTNRDGDAVANATVTLIPNDMPESPLPRGLPTPTLKQARTDQNGAFSLRGIAPDRYRLFAWETGEGVPFLDNEFMRRFLARGEPVNIQEGDAMNLTLDVIPATETQ